MCEATFPYLVFFRLCLSVAVERPLNTLLAVSECEMTTSVSSTRPGETICRSGRCALVGSKSSTSRCT